MNISKTTIRKHIKGYRVEIVSLKKTHKAEVKRIRSDYAELKRRSDRGNVYQEELNIQMSGDIELSASSFMEKLSDLNSRIDALKELLKES